MVSWGVSLDILQFFSGECRSGSSPRKEGLGRTKVASPSNFTLLSRETTLIGLDVGP